MTTCDIASLTDQFESHELDAKEFGHMEHVQVAYEMLHRYDFLDAATRYSGAIKALATRAGAPEKFNVTITLAFLSLIAERANETGHPDINQFLALNEDLKSGSVLKNWYTSEALQSDFARTHFLLPDKGVQL